MSQQQFKIDYSHEVAKKAHNRVPFENIYMFTSSVRKIEDGEEIVEGLYSFEASRTETSRGALEHVTRRDVVPSSVFFYPIHHSTYRVPH